MRPTRRAILLFVPAVPLALLLVVWDPAWWAIAFDYAALVLLAMASDAALSLPRRRLMFEVAAPERLHVGEPGAVRVTLRALGRHPRAVPIELLAEQRGDLDPPEIVATLLPPGGKAVTELRLLPRRRGRVQLDRIWLRWQGPLGLIERLSIEPVFRAIDVLPNIRGVERAALRFLSQEAVFGVKPQAQRGEGSEFEALRDYAPGFDTRFIDWKHSARHRRLLCKEFRTERNNPIVLAFDTGYLMREPIEGVPRLDHAINAGLLLGWVSLQGGDLVGAFGFDAAVRQYLAPVRGAAGFPRLQQTVAALDYHGDETNFTLGLAELGARLKRRSLIVLFTEFVDTVTAELLIESLRRMTSRHLVVFVTLRDSLLQQTVDREPARFSEVAEAVVAHDLLRERSIVFERLMRLGIHCLDVPSRGLSVALVNRYLAIKERGLL
ncbi:MAG TPA: DUF58 domain-containing protein [Stellaceae bacterium]|nr:DUF58 domain-containing protein [Stellaceae bacterium]